MIVMDKIDNNISTCFLPLCAENAIASYANYFNVEYQTTFAYAMRFDFDENLITEGRLADGLNLKYRFWENLKDVYGIVMQSIVYDDFDEFVNYLNEQIVKKSPVIIHMDSYYLKWSTLYNVRHTDHICICIDIDVKKGIITILDTMDLEESIELSFDLLRNACKFYWYISIPEPGITIDLTEFDRQTIKDVGCLFETQMFDKMYRFAELFRDEFNPYTEFVDCENYNMMLEEKLVDEIRKVMSGINMFVIWLKWREKKQKTDSFSKSIELFKSVLSKWNVFMNLLYKQCLLKWKIDIRLKAYERLIDIIDTHKEAYYSYLNAIGQQQGDKLESITSVDRDYKSLPLNISDVCNNGGFVFRNSPIVKKNLTGVGEVFVIHEKYQSDKIYYKKGVCFNTNLNNEYDNISCDGQIIPVNEDCEIQGIAVLCCSEWGDSYDIIKIEDSNGINDFPIFVNDLPVFRDNSFIDGKTINVSNEEVIQEKAMLTVCYKNLRKTRVKKIVLPKCSHLHILAITLLV